MSGENERLGPIWEQMGLTQQQYNALWGTAGSPDYTTDYGSDPDEAFKSGQAVEIDGKYYMRVPFDPNSGQAPGWGRPQDIYDPRYGGLVLLDDDYRARMAENNQPSFLDKYATTIAGGMLGGVAMGGFEAIANAFSGAEAGLSGLNAGLTEVPGGFGAFDPSAAGGVPGVSSLPENYWNMTADSGQTAFDAMPEGPPGGIDYSNIDMGVGGTGLTETLSQYGLQPQQIVDFITQNLDNPQLVADMAQQFGMSVDDISQIMGVPANQVAQYFTTAGVTMPAAQMPPAQPPPGTPEWDAWKAAQAGASVTGAGAAVANALDSGGSTLPGSNQVGGAVTDSAGNSVLTNEDGSRVTTNPNGNVVNTTPSNDLPNATLPLGLSPDLLRFLGPILGGTLGGLTGGNGDPGSVQQTPYRSDLWDRLLNFGMDYGTQNIGANPDMQAATDAIIAAGMDPSWINAGGNYLLDTMQNLPTSPADPFLQKSVYDPETNPANQYLQGRLAGDINNPGSTYLQNQLDQGVNNPAMGFMQGQLEQGINNPANGFLQNMLSGGVQDPSSQYWQGILQDGVNNPAQGYMQAQLEGGLNNPTNPYLQSVLEGDYLNSNPYLDAMYGNAANRVQERVNSAFAGAGRYRSGINQEVMQRGLNELATDIYGKNYATERGNQQQAAGMLGSQYLTGVGLQNQLAGQLGNQYLQGVGLQNQAAGQQSSSYLQGLGLQNQAAGTLGSQYLQGVGLQNQLAQAMGSQYLQGQQQQNQAAGQLGSQYLQGIGLQNQAAGQLSNNFTNAQQQQMNAANLMSGDYFRGRNLQQQAAMAAPEFNAARFFGPTAALNAATQEQNYPWTVMNNMAGVLGRANGGSTVTNPPEANPWQNIIGGAATGMGLWNWLFPTTRT